MNWEWRFEHLGRGDRLAGVKVSYLPPNHDNAPIRGPADCQSLPSKLYSLHAPLAPDVPELACTIAGDRGQLGFLDRIPCDSLNAASVTAQFGAILDLRLFGIPDTKGAVCGASRY